MDTTYARLVRLAYTKPEFRPKLMPLLMKYAVPDYNKYRERKKKKGEKPLGRKEWHAKVMSTGEAQTKELSSRKEQYHEVVNALMDKPFPGATQADMLKDEDATEVKEYKASVRANAPKGKKSKGKKRPLVDIKQDFLNHCKNQETKDRIRKMSPEDFNQLLIYINEDEEGGGEGMGKGASVMDRDLRKATIKLAHAQPELRHVLLPLLAHTAAGPGPGRPVSAPKATGTELFNVYVGPKDFSEILKEVRLFSDPDTVKLMLRIADKLKAELEPRKEVGEALKALYRLANYPRKTLGAGFFQSKEKRAGLMHAWVRMVAAKLGLHSSALDAEATEYASDPRAVRYPPEHSSANAEMAAVSDGATPWL